MFGCNKVQILKVSVALTALLFFLLLLLQATQDVCCNPSASPVCPSCCSTSSIRLRSTASWQGTPSRPTSTVSAAFIVKVPIVESASWLSFVQMWATPQIKAKTLTEPTGFSVSLSYIQENQMALNPLCTVHQSSKSTLTYAGLFS